MPSLNCSQTKRSGCVPEGACTRTLCAPFLSALELERFRVSALNNGDARLEGTHGSPPATWSKVLLSQVILEEGMRLCRYRIDSSNCSDLKNGIYEILTSSTALFSSMHLNKLTLLLQCFHLTCHFWCLPRKGPALSEAAFFTYLPCSQF